MSASVADPVRVVEWAFGHDHCETSAAIIRAMDRPRAKVIAKACHSSSKTFTAADVVLLALLKGYDVVTTAPTQEQVERLLWGHIRRAIDTSPEVDRSVWGKVNLTEIRMDDGAFAVGLATRPEEGGVRFQGHHARPGSALVVVIDEAIGVNPGIFEAVEGFSAGGDVRRLYLCNPTIASGPIYDIFASADPTWVRITIDAFDTPNLLGLTLPELLAMPEHELDDNVRPYLVTRRWVRDMYHLWGEDHPLWQSRVRGRFPLQADDALLSLAWLEAAAVKTAAYDAALTVQAGVDVAGPGDDETVLCIRQGDAILHLQSWSKADPRGEVVAALAPWKDLGLDAVAVDVAGIGYYFALALEDEGLPVVRVNVGESPTDDKAKAKYVNLRAELFWTFREWVADGMLAGLTDQTALAQLAGIRYEHDARGRIAIERKVDARKRGVKSPDRAEAIALSFWARPKRTVSLQSARPIVRGGHALDKPKWEQHQAEQAIVAERQKTRLSMSRTVRRG